MSDEASTLRLAAALVDALAHQYVELYEAGEDGPLDDYDTEDGQWRESPKRVIKTVIPRFRQTIAFLESALERPPLERK